MADIRDGEQYDSQPGHHTQTHTHTHPCTHTTPHTTYHTTHLKTHFNSCKQMYITGSITLAPPPHTAAQPLSMMALLNLHPSGPIPHSLISKSVLLFFFFFQRLLTVLLVILSPCSQHPPLCLNNNQSPVLRGPPV